MRTFPRRTLLLCVPRGETESVASRQHGGKIEAEPRTTQQARGIDVTTVEGKESETRRESEKGKRARGMVVAW